MNARTLRRAARQTLRDATISPYRVTLLYLLAFQLIAIPYNVFSLFYSYAADAQAAGLDAIGRIGRYYVFTTVSPLLLTLLSNLWDAAYTGYTVALHRDPRTGFRAITDSLRDLGRVLWLAVQVLMFTFLWMCLFILPGIVAFYRYRFAFQILFDHPEMSASQALRESKAMTYGYKLTLLQLDLSYFYYYLLLAASSTLANLPALYELPMQGLQADLLCYLAGNALALAVQAAFLPRLRTAVTEAYFAISSEERIEAI